MMMFKSECVTCHADGPVLWRTSAGKQYCRACYNLESHKIEEPSTSTGPSAVRGRPQKKEKAKPGESKSSKGNKNKGGDSKKAKAEKEKQPVPSTSKAEAPKTPKAEAKKPPKVEELDPELLQPSTSKMPPRQARKRTLEMQALARAREAQMLRDEQLMRPPEGRAPRALKLYQESVAAMKMPVRNAARPPVKPPVRPPGRPPGGRRGRRPKNAGNAGGAGGKPNECGRRTLFKKTPMKTPTATATIVTSESIYFEGKYMQSGDIVSMLDEDGDTYYAQIRGFMTDQYYEKSAVVTWLLPTRASMPPALGFEPSTYIIGPDEDLPRKLEYMEFIMHAPPDYYHSRTSPYPHDEYVSKSLGGYIWTSMDPVLKPQKTQPQSTETQPSGSKQSEPQPSTSKQSEPQPSTSKQSEPQPSTSKQSEPRPSGSKKMKSKQLVSQSSGSKKMKSQASVSKHFEPQPSTSKQSEPQPSTSKQSEPQPSTSKQSEPQPSTSKQSEPQPSTSKQSEPQPSTSKQFEPQPSTSKQ